ncbi:hypothetical protein M8J76_014823 [Diaphorina citri]|nr:hypothetical protein M8J76_001563 [Diaphorina citri]KAI5719788.1 hypothetical protein M8J76_014823 [Diaphorina citri]
MLLNDESVFVDELFEDIGPLIASRVVRPGTAEVIYTHQKDAIKAVEIYHNRQLTAYEVYAGDTASSE